MSAETRMNREVIDSITVSDQVKPTEVLFCGLIGIWAVLGIWFSTSLLVVFMN